MIVNVNDFVSVTGGEPLLIVAVSVTVASLPANAGLVTDTTPVDALIATLFPVSVVSAQVIVEPLSPVNGRVKLPSTLVDISEPVNVILL